MKVKGGPRVSYSTALNPTAAQLGMFDFDPTPVAVDERDFDSDMFAVRAQVDF